MSFILFGTIWQHYWAPQPSACSLTPVSSTFHLIIVSNLVSAFRVVAEAATEVAVEEHVFVTSSEHPTAVLSCSGNDLAWHSRLFIARQTAVKPQVAQVGGKFESWAGLLWKN